MMWLLEVSGLDRSVHLDTHNGLQAVRMLAKIMLLPNR